MKSPVSQELQTTGPSRLVLRPRPSESIYWSDLMENWIFVTILWFSRSKNDSALGNSNTVSLFLQCPEHGKPGEGWASFARPRCVRETRSGLRPLNSLPSDFRSSLDKYYEPPYQSVSFRRGNSISSQFKSDSS